MVQIFISHTLENADYADYIRQSLEAKGYSVWREPKTLKANSILYPRTIENAILGSAAVILVWSSSAAQSEWIERHIFFAQRLKKLIVPVTLENTSLPSTFIMDAIITNQASYDSAVTHLLPHLPQPDTTKPVIVLSEQAAHNFIHIRKEAIYSAAEMLKRGDHREEVLAILEYLAHHDLMMEVRVKAQKVLDIDAKQEATLPFRHDESRHIFGVRCKNAHLSYFDKRQVCSAYKEVPRDIRQSAGQELDELHLKCDKCGVDIVARVDCRGYK